MKRIIKFRGKDIEHHKWVYGSLIVWPDGETYIADSGKAGDIVLRREEVDPDTVGQFTGLCDAQGKEIYEGDILRMSYRKDDLGVVKWRNEKSAFTIQEMGKLRWWYLMDRKDEIVGNIHDNKLEDFK